jgi:hypothetical protein
VFVREGFAPLPPPARVESLMRSLRENSSAWASRETLGEAEGAGRLRGETAAREEEAVAVGGAARSREGPAAAAAAGGAAEGCSLVLAGAPLRSVRSRSLLAL